MSISKNKRTLLVSLIFFIHLSVYFKLVSYREDWLYFSLMWAISWGIGYWCSKTINEKKGQEKLVFILLTELLIAYVVTLLLMFITGVVMDLQNWNWITSNIAFPFAISLLISNEWKQK